MMPSTEFARRVALTTQELSNNQTIGHPDWAAAMAAQCYAEFVYEAERLYNRSVREAVERVASVAEHRWGPHHQLVLSALSMLLATHHTIRQEL